MSRVKRAECLLGYASVSMSVKSTFTPINDVPAKRCLLGYIHKEQITYISSASPWVADQDI
ncbi:hypothetical protein PENANT_c021G00153 [Penicillium antarcticum]|uniref:Uncharacterized protein n=1 Tax=Penicillium antarcticum TaxID=416450 RepID=A0A1V6Q1D1_9EURO|nr:uncharacterized protein N7508_010861 [Penicillium antarcticum]KAJ5296040.1 hypothetical protein N7508_010861 [Penicillium antarcticum]OQD82516.1 hypothetical protein PENANT_c021G00153 [Penicillium antarcticum]